MIGIGAALHYLGGGSPKSASDYYGRKIKAAQFDAAENEFRLTFDDGVTVRIWDGGQSCCENRWMTCDDDPADLIVATLTSVEVVEGPKSSESEYGIVSEVDFLNIKTDKGQIQFATHNEHNGYYGGFGLSLDEVSSDV